MNNTNKAQFSIKRDVRTGSPRRLWRTLHDFLDDNGFGHEYEELRFDGTPIEGTATFSDGLVGHRDYEKQAPLWVLRVIIGLLLCLTIILIPFGLALIRSSRKTIRTRIEIGVEGEAYRARGADVTSAHAAEVFDVVADTRITLSIEAGEASEANEYEIEGLAEDKRDIADLRHEFEELSHGLDGLLPNVSLPVPSRQVNEIP